MSELVGHVEFPPEWKTADWLQTDVIAHAKFPCGHVVLSGGVLADGTNWMALTFPGGARLMRVGTATRWGIEERLVGEDPAPAIAGQINKLWRIAIEANIKGQRETEAELGRPMPGRRGPA